MGIMGIAGGKKAPTASGADTRGKAMKATKRKEDE
jgi:hypothetical protein